MIRVLLVDDHELVRSGIEALLSTVEDIEVVGVCESGEKALQQLAVDVPDVVLMDINMPGMGGFEACRQILKKFPATRIICLSVQNSGPIPQQLLKLGVMGFVSKGSPVREMVTAIKTVIAGGRYLCQDVANNLVMANIEGEKANPFSQLSRRETEVAQLILRGRGIQEIADMLAVSDKTVNTYRYRIYAKLNIRNDVELTRLAVKFNYLEAF